MRRTHYLVLHVLRSDSEEVIREAYKRVRKAHEPGLLAHDPAIIAEARLAKEAFETLIDPARRVAYDSDMGLTTSSFMLSHEVDTRPVPFWTLTRLIVWSTVLILILLAVFYRPHKAAIQNPAPYLKNFDPALAKPTSDATQTAETPAPVASDAPAPVAPPPDRK
jgi:hypothetical protein